MTARRLPGLRYCEARATPAARNIQGLEHPTTAASCEAARRRIAGCSPATPRAASPAPHDRVRGDPFARDATGRARKELDPIKSHDNFFFVNRADLIRRTAAGESFKWLFFWGHTPKTPGRVDASCLSQWYPASFELDGVRYATAEHAMMAEKARLFGDDEAVARVLVAKSPAEAKAIGREVRGYVDEVWAAKRETAVLRGNVAKFDASDALREFLLSTGERILVEASPRDTVWGIGLGGANPAAQDPSRWRGQNLLGFALMEARRILREKTKKDPLDHT